MWSHLSRRWSFWESHPEGCNLKSMLAAIQELESSGFSLTKGMWSNGLPKSFGSTLNPRSLVHSAAGAAYLTFENHMEPAIFLDRFSGLVTGHYYQGVKKMGSCWCPCFSSCVAGPRRRRFI